MDLEGNIYDLQGNFIGTTDTNNAPVVENEGYNAQEEGEAEEEEGQQEIVSANMNMYLNNNHLTSNISRRQQYVRQQ